jgi:hypothetical protein
VEGRVGARRTWRLGAAFAGGVTIMLAIAACAGFWKTPVQLGKLIVGAVQVTGTTGTVLVSVADMPDGGLGAIQFGTLGNEAITFTNIDPASIRIEGKSGFVVLAQAFAGGSGALIAAGCDGVVGGEILRFMFTVIGAHPTFAVTKAKVSLVSDGNAFITAWELGTTAYYAR